MIIELSVCKSPHFSNTFSVICNIMKTVLTIISFCFFTHIYSQKCECSNNPDLKNLISCKQTRFQNGAKIYWNYDCNSSWIIFENGKIKKKIFELDKQSIEYSGRLGYRNWREYKNAFLIENSLVSGCCQPSEFTLYNKNNGKKIAELGTIIFFKDSKENQFALTFNNNNNLLFTKLNENKYCRIKIPQNLIEIALKNSNELYPENLFENIKFKNELLTFDIKYKEKQNSVWKKKTIIFDTKKYCR